MTLWLQGKHASLHLRMHASSAELLLSASAEDAAAEGQPALFQLAALCLFILFCLWLASRISSFYTGRIPKRALGAPIRPPRSKTHREHHACIGCMRACVSCTYACVACMHAAFEGCIRSGAKWMNASAMCMHALMHA